ncbi:MAG: hypothetical protein SGJ11_07360 [Phycisphaerae bacterium]|nr:hypothetical protein [Phycisphaerae bacterium]
MKAEFRGGIRAAAPIEHMTAKQLESAPPSSQCDLFTGTISRLGEQPFCPTTLEGARCVGFDPKSVLVRGAARFP